MKHRYRKSRIRHIKPRSRDRLTNPKALIIAVWLIYVLVLAVPQVCHGQSLQCWTWSLDHEDVGLQSGVRGRRGITLADPAGEDLHGRQHPHLIGHRQRESEHRRRRHVGQCGLRELEPVPTRRRRSELILLLRWFAHHRDRGERRREQPVIDHHHDRPFLLFQYARAPLLHEQRRRLYVRQRDELQSNDRRLHGECDQYRRQRHLHGVEYIGRRRSGTDRANGLLRNAGRWNNRLRGHVGPDELFPV